MPVILSDGVSGQIGVLGPVSRVSGLGSWIVDLSVHYDVGHVDSLLAELPSHGLTQCP